MREFLARKLVRIVGYCYDRAYLRYVNFEERSERRWAKLGKRTFPLVKLAQRIDGDNAVEQMAREGWWG